MASYVNVSAADFRIEPVNQQYKTRSGRDIVRQIDSGKLDEMVRLFRAYQMDLDAIDRGEPPRHLKSVNEYDWQMNRKEAHYVEYVKRVLRGTVQDCLGENFDFLASVFTTLGEVPDNFHQAFTTPLSGDELRPVRTACNTHAEPEEEERDFSNCPNFGDF